MGGAEAGDTGARAEDGIGGALCAGATGACAWGGGIAFGCKRLQPTPAQDRTKMADPIQKDFMALSTSFPVRANGGLSAVNTPAGYPLVELIGTRRINSVPSPTFDSTVTDPLCSCRMR